MPVRFDELFVHRNKCYKMLLVLSFLDLYEDGSSGVPLDSLATRFVSLLAEREQRQLPVDSPPNDVGSEWSSARLSSIKSLVQTPLQALRDIFVRQSDDTIGLTEQVINSGPSALHQLREAASQALDEYWTSLTTYRSQRTETYVELRTPLLRLMTDYASAKRDAFKGHPMHEHTRILVREISELDFLSQHIRVKGSIGQGNWATVPWIAFMDTRITSSTRRGVYVCYLFAEDMSACYLTIARGVTEPIEQLGRKGAYQVFKEQNERDRLRHHFSGMSIDDNVHLTDQGLGRDYEVSVIAYIKYERDSLPSNEQLLADLQKAVSHYEHYYGARLSAGEGAEPPYHTSRESKGQAELVKELVSQIEAYIASHGFYYNRHLLSNLIIAVKVRPFVILAGISGTGKSKIVSHVARALGSTRENGRFLVIPVRPDWSDPSDLLGYRNLQGDFVPGPLTEILERAFTDPTNPYFVLIDEMNLARVEYYLSDVLSVIETQRWHGDRLVTDPIIQTAGLNDRDRERYGSLIWPENVLLVGTVNMDETTHSISKKVLDRATTIEVNEVDLNLGLHDVNSAPISLPEVASHNLLRPTYLVLRDVPKLYHPVLERVVAALSKVNTILQSIGAQIGYRVRDVVSFYVVYSLHYGLFTEEEALDIQFLQKILPRIQGSSGSLHRVLFELLQFFTGENMTDDPGAHKLWLDGKWKTAHYPKSTYKVADMLRRLDEDGFTSYWIT